MIKRMFDLLVALSGFVVLVPLLAAIIVLIILSDGWPVVFRQKRIGKNGKPFWLYKFRSMRNSGSGQTENFEAGDISRVTRIGKFLRATKLDELLQLINVIKGDMSLVGPRPEVEKWVNVYPERWANVLSVRPGITDNAAILFRNEERLLAHSPDPEATYRELVLPRKLDLYDAYVAHHTLSGDVVLILKTIYSIFIRTNYEDPVLKSSDGRERVKIY